MNATASRLVIQFVVALLSFGRIEPSKAQPVISVVVPNSLENSEGNTGASVPFDGFHGSMRYQQVYAASQFSAISNGGGSIKAILF